MRLAWMKVCKSKPKGANTNTEWRLHKTRIKKNWFRMCCWFFWFFFWEYSFQTCQTGNCNHVWLTPSGAKWNSYITTFKKKKFQKKKLKKKTNFPSNNKWQTSGVNYATGKNSSKFTHCFFMLVLNFLFKSLTDKLNLWVLGFRLLHQNHCQRNQSSLSHKVNCAKKWIFSSKKFGLKKKKKQKANEG